MTIVASSAINNGRPIGADCSKLAMQSAISGQSLPQSDAGVLCGQHGIPAGLAVAVCVSVAPSPLMTPCVPEDIATAGRASGASISPAMASIANERRMAEEIFTSSKYHKRSDLAK
jgi:hypothetical protein